MDGQVVLLAAGRNTNRMALHTRKVCRWAGRTARIQGVDRQNGSWGNIGWDHILFTDQPRHEPGPLAEESDFGTMTLALWNASPEDLAAVDLPDPSVPAGIFSQDPADRSATATRSFGQKLLGALARKLSLGPGESAEAVFFVTWHFPDLRMGRLAPGRHYGTRFASALTVAEHLGQRYGELRELTHPWHDTWNDSILPYWFLGRTFPNTSILATLTCHRSANGRFWGWEGVGCCASTSGHVWQYAQAVVRLFPELERDTRERLDFGLALQKGGAIHFRAEVNNIPAVDGQAGTILRALREHQMTPDDSWLKKNWLAIKRATEGLIARDGDGLIEGNQHNTLGTDWFGPVAWLSGMYLAALRR